MERPVLKISKLMIPLIRFPLLTLVLFDLFDFIFTGTVSWMDTQLTPVKLKRCYDTRGRRAEDESQIRASI